MLTAEDKIFIAAIKKRILSAGPADITVAERQQVLDILERSGEAVPLSVHVAAANEGFDTTRIPIASAY